MPAAFHICKSILVPIAGGTFRTARALTCHWPRLRARPRQPLAPILSSTQWQPTAMGLVQSRSQKQGAGREQHCTSLKPSPHAAAAAAAAAAGDVPTLHVNGHALINMDGSFYVVMVRAIVKRNPFDVFLSGSTLSDTYVLVQPLQQLSSAAALSVAGEGFQNGV